MEENIAISITDLSKKYKLYLNKTDRVKEALSFSGRKYHSEFFAVRNLSLEVHKGEILGIVGKNGSGKSTLLKMIAGILQSTTGSIKTSGRIVPMLELGAGFNPEYTGLENIYFYNSFLGFTRKETEKRIKAISDFADIGDFINQPFKTYSSGMKARLAFAVSVNVDPEILIVDEVLSVGDELFRRKSYAKMEEFFKSGKTVLFVSHSSDSINQLCSRAILLNNGEIIYDGSPKETTKTYQKLIYSKGDDRTVLLNETKKRYAEVKSKPRNYLNEKLKPYFIPNFVPQSTIDINNSNIQIWDIRIETIDGEIVNCLIEGEEYKYKYEIFFIDNEYNVSLGFRIKSDKGLHISGYSLGQTYERISMISPGHYTVSFSFICALRPGNYYKNQGGFIINDG